MKVGYKLDENDNWAINVAALKGNLEEARKHCEPRIMVVINPGNPTGRSNTYCNVVFVEVAMYVPVG